MSAEMVKRLKNMDPEARALLKRSILRGFAQAEGKPLHRYDEDRDNLRVIPGGLGPRKNHDQPTPAR